MFKLEAFNSEIEAGSLTLSDSLFHDALREAPESLARFHVHNDKGEDFDIVYLDNDEDLEPSEGYPAYVKPPYIASYRYYDENDTETIYLEFLNPFDTMMFEVLDEYTIALTKVILANTTMEVWCRDARIFWFVDQCSRIHIVDTFPENRFKESTLYIQEQFRCGLEDGHFNRLSSVYAFHNLFFLQWILNGRDLRDFKFLTMPINDTGGIGALLSAYSRNQKLAERLGLTFVAPDVDHFGKYPRALVEKYFAVDIWNTEANASNTLTVPNTVIINKSQYYISLPATLNADYIAPGFKAEMDEYFDAVLGGKKVLGLLIRGSDYLSNNLGSARKMATVEQMTPKIREWMAEFGYEKLFLATEDSDILAQMRKEFGRSMVALAQKRLSVNDLRQGQIISDYEKENNREDYAVKLEDTTINYFYALYILSKCDAFLCSGQCNGWDNVLSLNSGKFERSYKFTVGITGDPITEDWKEIRQITAGMFARAAYPVDKAFFMTYRFDLAENVDPDALRQAWEKTLTVYPYMSYAVVPRTRRLLLTENPLPFVIKETGEILEPFERSGNFHMVTFGYLGKTLWIYADHVPLDGTGFQFVMETFFYHYYCLVDGVEYPVPAGVFTEKDGAVEGQDVDAYRMADAIDPRMLMKAFLQEDTFSMPECEKEVMFPARSDCRAYCLSVPGSEMITHAKAIGGSPMSVLAVAFAKAVQRVHPENTLPVKMLTPVSIRKVMGNSTSLLHQVVHANYSFAPSDLAEKSDAELNGAYRAFLNGFMSEQNIKMLAGVYRGVCEGYTKAFAYGALDKITMEQRANAGAGMGVSYLGILRTGEYGNRIGMKAFHAMAEKGLMLQMSEVGDTFYICWYQGFHDTAYVCALRDVLAEMGMKGMCLERTE